MKIYKNKEVISFSVELYKKTVISDFNLLYFTIVDPDNNNYLDNLKEVYRQGYISSYWLLADIKAVATYTVAGKCHEFTIFNGGFFDLFPTGEERIQVYNAIK